MEREKARPRSGVHLPICSPCTTRRRMGLFSLACTLLAPLVSGHAILLDATSGADVAYPRTGISGTQGTGAGISGSGTKLRPFTDAKMYADETKCGGAGAGSNNDPGVQTPLVAFSPGDQLTVKWRMTIPHPTDYPLDAPLNTASPGSGVRIAMHYGATDSFEDNILAGGVVGDPGEGTLAAGTDATERNGEVTETITLGAKTCDYCTLQWIWAANGDGGSYLMCIDISITANGQLPDFNAVPSEVGKLVAGTLHRSIAPCALTLTLTLTPSLHRSMCRARAVHCRAYPSATWGKRVPMCQARTLYIPCPCPRVRRVGAAAAAGCRGGGGAAAALAATTLALAATTLALERGERPPS